MLNTINMIIQAYRCTADGTHTVPMATPLMLLGSFFWGERPLHAATVAAGWARTLPAAARRSSSMLAQFGVEADGGETETGRGRESRGEKKLSVVNLSLLLVVVYRYSSV